MNKTANNSGTTSPTIGVFDSGFGGLTVLRALMAQMPHARFVFFGDTARLPYGSKSRRTIARYAAQCAQFLVNQQGAEFLVIACNTASALALDAIQDAVQVPVLGVIEPGAEAARAASRTGDVLVIATDATVQSHAYAAACRAHGLRALEKACPLLVPLVEEGWTGPLAGDVTEISAAQAAFTSPQVAVTAEVIRIYLAELTAEAAAQGMNPDALVLGCTHYPLLRPLLERAVPAGMKVIDSADATAEAAVKLFGQQESGKRSPSAQDPSAQDPSVQDLSAQDPSAQDPSVQDLSAQDPSAQDPSTQDQVRCFATDSVEKFERLGSRFLRRPTGKVELVDLGG
jgi:glutamate racemase